jgi:hypothetical protein
MTSLAPSPTLEMPTGFSMHRVVTREDWSRVRGLRYEALAARGDIASSEHHVHCDEHDLALNASTFLLTRNGRAIGSARASVSSPNRHWTVPAMQVFNRAIHAAIGLESTVVEASLMVVDPATTIDRRIVLCHLMRVHMLQCAGERADWFITTVRDTEIGFYRRMLGMEILSGAEACPGMAAPRVLMGLQYREHAAALFKRLPILAVTAADVAEFASSGCVRFPQRAMSQQAA